MDEGPFRVSRPAARRANQPSPPIKTEEKPSRPVQESRAERPVTPEPTVEKKKKPSIKSIKKPGAALVAVAIIVAVLVIGFVVWSFSRGGDNGIDSSKYQAVFLANGEHYFGKLEDVNDKYMKLTDIYYLQRTSSDDESETGGIQQSAGSQNNVELKKLGDEVHGPEDQMMISRENILYYENLKPEGQATRAIEEHKKTSN